MVETKIIYRAKDEGAVDHSTVTRWFQKFGSGYYIHDYQAKSGRLKTMDSEAILQVIEANPASSTVIDELGILVWCRLLPSQP